MRIFFICFIIVLLFMSCADNDNLTPNPYNPVSPWGITFDGENLWVTEDSLNMIYKLDLELNLKDSFAITKPYIRGIDFIDDKLWIVSDSSVGDSTGDSFIYDKYYIYGIDRYSGAIIDSVLLFLPQSGMPDGNFLWGIGSFNSNIYISYNGGYGDCMLEVNLQSKEMKTLCCAHPMGFSVIDDTLWCARHGSEVLVPIVISNPDVGLSFCSEMNIFRYELGFQATDLAFDGENVWVVDKDSSLIREITDLR